MTASAPAPPTTNHGKTAPGPVDPDSAPEAHSRPLDWNLIVWLLGYTRPHRTKRNILLGLVILRSLQLPLLAWATGQLINGPITQRNFTGLIWGVAGFLLLAALTQLTLHFRQRFALELGEAVVRDLRLAIFTHLQQMRLGFFHRTRLGRIISRATSDVEAVRTGVQDVLFVGLVNAGQILGASAMLCWCDLVLFLVVVGMAPVIWCINLVFRKRLSQVHRDVHESFSRVTSSLAEAVNGVQVTQSFVRQDENARQFRDLIEDHSQYNLRAARTAGVFLPLLEINSQAFLAALLVVGGYLTVMADSTTGVGNLVQFLLLANLLLQPIQTLGEQYNQALTAMAGAERVRELLATEPEWSDPPDAVALANLTGHVEFDQVSFAYEPGRTVLEEISFEARPGETIALVGHSGSGKSTLVSLLAKFYLPCSGRLAIDGVDVRQLATPCLRQHIAIVQQQNFLFTGTVLDNIRFARPEGNEAAVRDVLRQLDCEDLLEALPAGLHTLVGERGTGLSLGQRQLICFARAMLADPRILILDEATSSVDMMTELRIQTALRRLLAGRTSFVVAHRLSTIRDADQVLVLDQGRIVERGTHEGLLAERGAYFRLYDQFVRSRRLAS